LLPSGAQAASGCTPLDIWDYGAQNIPSVAYSAGALADVQLKPGALCNTTSPDGHDPVVSALSSVFELNGGGYVAIGWDYDKQAGQILQ